MAKLMVFIRLSTKLKFILRIIGQRGTGDRKKGTDNSVTMWGQNDKR